MATLTITVKKEYMVPFGILKAIQFVTVLLGWTIITNIHDGGWTVPGRVQFFISMGVIVWLVVIVWFLLNLFKMVKKIPITRLHIWIAVVHFVLGGLLLIASGLITHWSGFPKWDAGIIFGFIGSCALIVDGILHILLGKDLYAPPLTTVL